MAAELVAVEQYIRTLCTGSAPLIAQVPGGFHSERQHAAAPGRYVLWSFGGAPADTVGAHAQRILSAPLYLIRVVDKVGSYLPLAPAADLLDQALMPNQQAAGPMAFVIGGTHYTVQAGFRERPYSRVEHYVDLEWRHLGGYYRFYVQPY